MTAEKRNDSHGLLSGFDSSIFFFTPSYNHPAGLVHT